MEEFPHIINVISYIIIRNIFVIRRKMTLFIQSGPAEVLRAVQKDQILFELIEKKISTLLIKIFGRSIVILLLN